MKAIPEQSQKRKTRLHIRGTAKLLIFLALLTAGFLSWACRDSFSAHSWLTLNTGARQYTIAQYDGYLQLIRWSERHPVKRPFLSFGRATPLENFPVRSPSYFPPIRSKQTTLPPLTYEWAFLATHQLPYFVFIGLILFATAVFAVIRIFHPSKGVQPTAT